MPVLIYVKNPIVNTKRIKNLTKPVPRRAYSEVFILIVQYCNIGTAYNLKANRISLSHGRVREGLLCVGGICRNIPAYKGLILSVMSSF